MPTHERLSARAQTRLKGAGRAALSFTAALLGAVSLSALASDTAVGAQALPDRPRIVVPAGAVRPGTLLVGRYDGVVNDVGEPFTVEGEWLKCYPTQAGCQTVQYADGSLALFPNLTYPFETTYVVQPEDVGYSFMYSVFARGTDPDSHLSQLQTSREAAFTSDAPVAIASGSITLTGTPRDGEATQVRNTVSWLGTPPFTYDYWWERCDAAGRACVPSDEVVTALRPSTAADVGHRLRVRWTITNAFGTRTVTSAPTPVIEPITTASDTPPTLAGEPRDGAHLHAEPGTWRGTAPLAFRYVWQRCDATGNACRAVPGQDAETLTLGREDVGATARLVVTATGPGGSATATSEPTAIVAARPPVNLAPPRVAPPVESTEPVEDGGPAKVAIRVGTPLSVRDDAWDGTGDLDFDVQWERCTATISACQQISAATLRSYTPVRADVDHAVRARITATNPAGTAEAVTDPVLVRDAPLQLEPKPPIVDELPPPVLPAIAALPIPVPQLHAASRGPHVRTLLSFTRPSTRCVKQLRTRLPASGPLSVRGQLPGQATVLAGGRPVVAIATAGKTVTLRKPDGRLLALVRDVDGARWLRRSASRVSMTSTGRRLLVAIGARRALAKGRVCTVTSTRAISARADQAAPTTVWLTTDTGSPIPGAQLQVVDRDRHTTVQTDAHGRARLTLPGNDGGRGVRVTWAGDHAHAPAELVADVEVRALTRVRGTVDGRRLRLSGRTAGAAARVALQYRGDHGRWRPLANVSPRTGGRWSVRTSVPRRHAGGPQLIVRALVTGRTPYADRVGKPVRIDLDVPSTRRSPNR